MPVVSHTGQMGVTPTSLKISSDECRCLGQGGAGGVGESRGVGGGAGNDSGPLLGPNVLTHCPLALGCLV